MDYCKTMLHGARLLIWHRWWRVALLVLGMGLWAEVSHAQNPIYVDAEAACTPCTGINWTTAFTNVQDALTIARSGHEIWVAAGIYYPDEGNSQINNDPTSTFELIDGVALYGGFNATETIRNQRDPTLNLTILSGDIDNNDITMGGVVIDTANITGNNANHVISSDGVSDNTIVDGFTITAGQAGDGSGIPSCPADCGGGMYNFSSDPTLHNLVFRGNTAGTGGAIYNLFSSPTLSTVTLRDNTAGSGAGMFNNISSNPFLINVTFNDNSATENGGGMNNNVSSSPSLQDVTFEGNTANFGGGMLNFNNSSPTIRHITFTNNIASSLGGGMYNFNSSPIINNATFIGNTATRNGGGMYNANSNFPLTSAVFNGNEANEQGGAIHNDNSSPTLTTIAFSGNAAGFGGGVFNANNSRPNLRYTTFSGNTASVGGGIYNRDSSSRLHLTNAILWGNTSPQIENEFGGTAIISYSLIQGSGGSDAWNTAFGTDGGNNRDANPLFVNASGSDNIVGTADDNLQLQKLSPALDAGLDFADATTDLLGNTRDEGPAPDIGAFERLVTDVIVTKTASSLALFGGDPLTYTLLIANQTGATIPQMTITDTLPTQFIDATFTSSGGTVVDSGVRPGFVWTVANFGTATPIVITLTGQIDPDFAGTLVNTATVSTSLADPRRNRDVSSVTTTVVGVRPDIAIQKTATPAAIEPGNILTYTIVFTNQGTADSSIITITDAIPTQLSNISVTLTSDVMFTEVSTVPYIITAASLPLSATGIITMTGRVTNRFEGVFTNTVSVETPNDASLANNIGQAAVRVSGTVYLPIIQRNE